MSRVLHRLIRDNGVEPADIAVLMGSTRSGSLRRGKRIGAFQKWRRANARPEPVLRYRSNLAATVASVNSIQTSSFHGPCLAVCNDLASLWAASLAGTSDVRPM